MFADESRPCLQELGVFEAKAELDRAVRACVTGVKRVQRKQRVEQPNGEVRKSGRARAQVRSLVLRRLGALLTISVGSLHVKSENPSCCQKLH